MNKTININLGGIFFHIDENAYLKLKFYLDAINNSLQDDPQGKEEIINDIEHRISELLSAKITNERQVINESDVDEIIKVMGQPEDYQFDDELFESNPHTSKSKTKKLYRSSKDKILGGVSAGLGYYFGIDALWVRLTFILLTVFWGVGPLVYIILWIIVPEAKTTAEELEMKGEPVTIENIEKTIKQEYSKIENKVKNTDFSNVKNGFQQILDFLVEIVGVVFKFLGKFIGAILTLVAAIALIGIIIGLFSWGTVEIFGYNNDVIQYPAFFIPSVIPTSLLVVALITIIVIPVFYLFILGINILSTKKVDLGTTANLSIVGVWFLAIFMMVFAGIENQTKLSNTNMVNLSTTYDPIVQDTLSIKMLNNDVLVNRKSLYRSNQLDMVKNEKGIEMLYSSYVHLDIRKSSTDKITVKVLKTARGFSKEVALKKAEKIQYDYILSDRLLELNAYFLAPKELEYNKPKIDVIVYIPENQDIYIDASCSSFLYDVKNIQDIYDSDMPLHRYKMTSEGLHCTDCDPKENNDVALDINKNGLNINIDDGENQANVKIDQNGIEIK